MRIDRLIAFVLSVLLVAGSAQAALAQPFEPPPAAAVSASPAIVEAEQKLATAQADIQRLEARVEDNAENDSALVDLKLSVEALARSMLDIGVSLRPRLTEIKSRLEQLGAVPAEGEPAEPVTITEERARLAAERAMINSLTGKAETISVQANVLGDKITDTRRQLFANTLFKRTEIGPALMLEAWDAFKQEWSEVERTYGSWIKFVWTFKKEAALASVFFSLLAALFFIAGGYRLFGGLIERDADDKHPPYTSRLSVAFWSTVIPSIAVFAWFSTILLMANNFAVLRADITPVFTVLLGLLLALYFISKLAHGILAPTMPNWRLVKVSNGGARTLYRLVVLMALVNGLDYLLGSISETLGSPVVLTVAKGFFAAVIMALLLLITSRVKPMLAQSGDPDQPGEPWPRLISVSLTLAGLSLLAMALLGYVGMARFAATQIVVTGAILATMYIGYLSGQAISSPGAFAHTAVGRRLQNRFEPGQVALDQTGLAAGLMINLLVLLLGVPVILLQWGFQVQDIELWFYRVLTDIRIGGITISLVGILLGIVLFIVGLFATRWFQRWLDGSVMARGRMDTGVRNSIKTGIGYLGVAVAGLIGISAAGIDLSSLALVAGALSLGIGFGLQNIVSNFVSGLILLAERPFKVGDWVVTGSTEGFVKKISVRATEIETFTRQSIIVPNSELINSPVGNWTHRNKLGRVDIAVGVDYGTDPRQVIALLDEIARGHELVLRNPEPMVHFVGFGDSSLDFEIRAHIADVLNGLAVRTELRLRIFERFKAEGIGIPFPQRDLNIKLGEDAQHLAELAEAVFGKESVVTTAKSAQQKKARPGKPQKPAAAPLIDDVGSGGDGA